MRFGIMLGDQPVSVPAAEHFTGMLRQVEAAQRWGFRYIAIGQHFRYEGYRWLQPVPVLARLAAEVDRDVRLVTNVVVAPLYPPVLLAEELATLDVVTEGRLIAGLGMGYRAAEFQALGVPFDERRPRFEDAIEELRRLWADNHVTPVQPHLPIWIGAHKRAAIVRSARLGDGWPISPRVPFAELPVLLGVYFDARRAAGLATGPQPLRREVVVGRDRADAGARFRTLSQARYAAYAAQELSTSIIDPADHVVLGSPAECVEQLRSLAGLSIDPVIVRPHWPGMSVEEAVTAIDELGREVLPAFSPP